MKPHNEAPVWDGDTVCEVDTVGYVPAAQCLLWWQAKGLSETRSGYGSRLTSTWMVKVHGRWRRVRTTLTGNGGLSYLKVNGVERHVHGPLQASWAQVQAAGVAR